MRHRCLALLVVIAAATMVAVPAWAQSHFGWSGSAAWYLGAEGGWSALGNQEGSLPPKVFPQNFDDGFALGVRAGYRLGPWRVEEEYRYQSNDLNRYARHPAQGSRTVQALMTNALYDISLGWGIGLHVGGGIGPVALHDKAAVAALSISSVDDSTDWVFGYQAIAGVSYAITPRLTADLDYRYFATTTPHFTTAPGLVVDGVFTGDERVASACAMQLVLASLRWQFDAPAP